MKIFSKHMFKKSLLLFLIFFFNISCSQSFNDLKENGWNGAIKLLIIKRYNGNQLKNNKIIDKENWSEMQYCYFNSSSTIDSIHYFKNSKDLSKYETSIYKSSGAKRTISTYENKELTILETDEFINKFEYKSEQKYIKANFVLNSCVKLNTNYRIIGTESKGLNEYNFLILDEKDEFNIDENNLGIKTLLYDFQKKTTETYYHEYFDFDNMKNFKRSMQYKLINKTKVLNQITLKEITYY